LHDNKLFVNNLLEDLRKDGRTAVDPSHRNNNNTPVLNRQFAYRKRKKMGIKNQRELTANGM
jgi:hypothetical protein